MFMKTNKAVNKRNIFLMILFVAFLTAAFFYKSPAIFFVRSSVIKIIFPVMKKFSYAAEFLKGGYFYSSKDLIAENQKLKEENDTLILKLGDFILLERENEDLKKLLNFQGSYPFFDFAASRPIGFIRDGSDEYILISRGIKDGIHSDLWVIDSKKTLVGKVTEAYQGSSKVKLISSASEIVNGILPATGMRVLVKGNGFRELLIDLVPENTEVKEGDEVMAAESWEYPGLILFLGKIVEVGSTGAQVFKSVKALHYFDPQSLETVFVVRKQ
ncbi:MAG: Cell shape-determining protein MreC [Parcubacteria group bacterium GW2011_GWA2_42_14]|nr:MAG: Cell shape-determining protein MreC [Parcubacteria group bacterium GW2011_GWA2_42_14]